MVSLVAVLASCVGGRDGSSAGPQIRSHGPQLLGEGSAAGFPWRLTVFSSPDGNLCMGVNDHVDASASPETLAETGCGFGPPSDRDNSPVDSASAGDVQLLWGPAPPGAVRVRLDTYSLPDQAPTDSSAAAGPGCKPSKPAHLFVSITHRLPAWTTPGGWFITHATVTADQCGYADAVFFDREGKPVAERNW